MAVGPPAEEMETAPEAEVEEVEETLPQVQEKVRATTGLTLELTLAHRSHVTFAGRRRSLA